MQLLQWIVCIAVMKSVRDKRRGLASSGILVILRVGIKWDGVVTGVAYGRDGHRHRRRVGKCYRVVYTRTPASQCQLMLEMRLEIVLTDG